MRDNPLRGQQKPIQWPVLLSAAYLFEASSLGGGGWLRPDGRVKILGKRYDTEAAG